METIVGDRVSLAVGSPILIIGFTRMQPFEQVIARSDVLPEIVIAGRLADSYAPGNGLLLCAGPLAKNVGGRGFSHLAFEGPTGAFISLLNHHHDELNAYLYFATEDRARIVEVIERVQWDPGLRWPDQLKYVHMIARQVLTAYRALDPIEQRVLVRR